MNTYTLNQLISEDVRPIDYLVDGLLTPGLYVLAGPPKSGKSWLALWLCLCIARGQPLWEFAVQNGEVLCLSLEDNKQRLQNRLLDLLGEDDALETPVHFLLELDAEADLLTQLHTFVDAHPAVKLIVIDTLQKVRPRSGSDYSYAADYQIIGELKRFADQHELCVLVIHHTRKQGDPDPLNLISGTTGVSGAADGLLVLKPDGRTDNTATLLCTGRDIESRELRLSFDRDTLIWRMLGDSLEQPADDLLTQIPQLLPEGGGWSGTASQLSQLLQARFGCAITPAVLSKRLRRLEREWPRLGIEFHNRRTGQQRTLSFYWRAEPADTPNDGMTATSPPLMLLSQPLENAI